ncbi:MAG: PP2C family serine/threonine-protein phosphatase [Trueperaceae bacterium]
MGVLGPAETGSQTRVRFAGVSEAGRVRAVNQDSFFVGEVGGRGFLAMVADGMGGHQAGEVASRKAIEIVLEEFEKSRAQSPVAMARAVRTANLGIVDYAAEHPESFGMGTTLTAVLLDDQVGLVAHVGDSRAYLLRGNEIRPLTFDHSWVADRVRQGLLTEGEAKRHRYRNIITNALGAAAEIKLDVLHFEVRTGDRILLCSDGASMLLPDELLLSLASEGNPEEVADRIIAEADERGSPDNVTAVLMEVVTLEPRPKRYALPEGNSVPESVNLGETMSGVRKIEEAYAVQDLFARMRRQKWYPYRVWLLGSLYLLLLIVIFSLAR